jgi:polar amino acid transport system substrate-binding protein
MKSASCISGFLCHAQRRYWPALLLALVISLGAFFPARSVGLARAGRRAADNVYAAAQTLRQNADSEVGQRPNEVAVNLATELDAGWTAQHAQETPETAKIRVGIKRLEPFVFIDEDGRPSGFSVDLWNAIAADVGIQYEWVLASTVNELIAAVQSGNADAAIAGISMTPQRESLVDFSYPYFESGLQIMIRETPDAGSLNLTDIFFSSILFKLLGLGLILLVLMAHLIWLMEARSNPEMPKSYLAGVWDGLWWGLKMLIKQEYMNSGMPKNALKRLFVMGYMIFGIVLIAEFTAAITTSQTVSQLRATINGLSDLEGKRVLTVAGSTSEEFLLDQQVRHTTVERIEDAYDALLNDQADAIVFDAPVLLSYAQNQGYGLMKVVGPIFQEENYGIALPTGSPLRKPINSALLRLQSSGRYDAIYAQWFGSKE